MKKKTVKKLVLAKETVRHLGQLGYLKEVVGGLWTLPHEYTCPGTTIPCADN